MYYIERKSKILELLPEERSVSVDSLAMAFDVSKETIRRDLRQMESEGLLTRTHGGAVPLTTAFTVPAPSPAEPPVDIRSTFNNDIKHSLCRKAASYIKEGDNVYIDNSSTTVYLAQYIPENIQVTFITNSISFLIESSQLNNPNLTFVCLGGILNTNNLSTYGNIALRNSHDYFPNKAFLSCTGISEERQITDSSINEVDIKKEMIHRAKEVFILSDHTKFNKNGQIFLSNIENIHHIITDPIVDSYSHNFIDRSHTDIIFAE